MSTGGWEGAGTAAFNGAANGFMLGAISGGVFGAISAGVQIGSGSTQIIGRAHGSALHRLSSNTQASRMVLTGRYSQIGLNRSLNTMGLHGTMRPDVIGIGKNGINRLVEVVSARQNISYIERKMRIMIIDNPESLSKIVKWVRNIGRWIR